MSFEDHSLSEGSVEALRDEISLVMSEWRKDHSGPNLWKTPLVAVASADDPLFPRLKELIDPDHAVPRDLLPRARSVISFFLPFREWLVSENDETAPYAARSWGEAYVETNGLIAAISRHLKDALEAKGAESLTIPATHNFDEKKLVSLWSHKHVAYIAGLGTFGLHHQIITKNGCCGRLGSLVTSMALPVTPRPEGEWCLVKAGFRCKVCYTKCKFGALFEDHFDRQACYRRCLENDAHYEDLPLVDVCGKCACGVPCSHKVPDKIGA